MTSWINPFDCNHVYTRVYFVLNSASQSSMRIHLACFQAVVVMHNYNYEMWCDDSEAPLAHIRFDPLDTQSSQANLIILPSKDI